VAALGRIRQTTALSPLLETLNSPDGSRRLEGLRALGERGHFDAVGALQQAAKTDGDPRVVQAAVEALARLDAPQAIEALIQLTGDPAKRDVCVAALARGGEKQADWIARGLAHARPEVRLAVVDALRRMRGPAVAEKLSKALEDAESSVRLAVVSALTEIGSAGMEERLAAVASRDPDQTVRSAAQTALRRRGR
jgi:HEAT repeat protein